MCELGFDTTEFVLENVVDQNGELDESKCPECGENAKTRTFDSCHSGSVNVYYTLNCSHCGYHECDREECSICESQQQGCSDTDVFPQESFAASAEIDYMIDEIVDEMENKGRISAIAWTKIKLYLDQNIELLEWWIPPSGRPINQTRFEFISDIQRRLSDVRFNQRIGAKIANAM
ncbi:hypothetical protein L1D14_07290 [Vibrio tubiashii]|uniref:hypothetical protein n=1 Tax=Vibrio tubiashii TaxID=29498 RepID=UPI001EFD194D|nr:hypothetical protein [Vibrio tubiashii]MCG9576041.1 hypothetical protein [Vibrio tubiashii]